jgi:hypothetical protein
MQMYLHTLPICDIICWNYKGKEVMKFSYPIFVQKVEKVLDKGVYLQKIDCSYQFIIIIENDDAYLSKSFFLVTTSLDLRFYNISNYYNNQEFFMWFLEYNYLPINKNKINAKRPNLKIDYTFSLNCIAIEVKGNFNYNGLIL